MLYYIPRWYWISSPIAISGDSLFCMEEDDNRFEPMCCHYLSGSPCNDILLGAEECTSPFGTYELSMPIDDTIPCALNSSLITHKNCREFDVSFCVLIYELNLRKYKEWLLTLWYCSFTLHRICQRFLFVIKHCHLIHILTRGLSNLWRKKKTLGWPPPQTPPPNLASLYHGGTLLMRPGVDICPTYVNSISYTLKILIL